MSVANEISVGELAQIVQGRLRFADMPPLGGDMEPLERLTTDTDDVRPGDVVFLANGDRDSRPNCSAIACECFHRGALGVVVENEVAVWDGRFAIQVDDMMAAVSELACRARGQMKGRAIVVIEHELDDTHEYILGALRRLMVGGVSTCTRAVDAALALSQNAVTDDFSMLVWTPSGVPDIDQLSELWMPNIVVAASTNGHFDSRQVRDIESWSESLDVSGTLILSSDCDQMASAAYTSRAEVVTVGAKNHGDYLCERVRQVGEMTTFEMAGQHFKVANTKRENAKKVGIAYAVLRRFGVEEVVAANAAAGWNQTNERKHAA